MEEINMGFKDLQDYIKQLEEKGLLKRLSAEVDSELEITEIADRVSKQYGPALLFEKVKGSAYPVLINAMGTYERMSMALGVEKLDDIGEGIEEFIDMSNYLVLMKKIQSLPRLARMAAVFPIKLPTRGACQEVVEEDPDLGHYRY
jgi:4-hydroxy-3-polyprenylbenzoate decarboxylase